MPARVSTAGPGELVFTTAVALPGRLCGLDWSTITLLERHHLSTTVQIDIDQGPLPPLDVWDERPDVEVVSLCGRDTRATSVSPRSARSTTALTVL